MLVSRRELSCSATIECLAHLRAVKYIWNKGPIAGDRFKIPFIGPFLESVYPDFDRYYRKWMSGPLSCVSVFHKYENEVAIVIIDF